MTASLKKKIGKPVKKSVKPAPRKTIKAAPKAVKVAEAVVATVKQVKTQEQVADVSKAANSFEGAKRIDHLTLEEQMSQVFNPLHTITKTAVGENITPSTFIVNPKTDKS